MTGRKFGWLLAFLAVLVFVGACGSDGGPTGNGGDVKADEGTLDQSGKSDLDSPDGSGKPNDLLDDELKDPDVDVVDLVEDLPPEIEEVWDVQDVQPELSDVDLELTDLEEEVADVVEEIEPDEVEVEIVPPCELGTSCDDGDPCTLNDFCTEDGCVGEMRPCSDNLECTFDLCVDGSCVNDMKPGWCYIWGQCWEEGSMNPNNPCLECITSHRIYTWSSDDSNECNDENPCTLDDSCHSGTCAGEMVTCDDGEPCTTDFCVDGVCYHQPLNAVSCDDGDLCTIGDLCISGECIPGDTERNCDDFNDCTADTCDPVEGCVYMNMDGESCEDGNLCTSGDTCQSSLCLPGPAVVCEDNNPCTTDSCSPYVGCKFINNNLLCNDGDPCSIGDQCIGGVCKKGSELYDCDDGNTCTSEWCAVGQGCVYSPLVAPCSDGDSCTYGDHCEAGECVYEFELECDDGNPCTNDICDEAFGCANINNSIPCTDNNACTIGDQCVDGACTPGVVPLMCFEGNPCADGYCDPDYGCIMQPNDDMPCNDGNECTLQDMCSAGECFGTALQMQCDDGNVCTLDWCDESLGCMHSNVDSYCNDLSACTTADQCVDGMCMGTPISCDDGNPCTMDACDVSQGCQYSVLVTAFCQPQLVIDYPPRAAELYGPSTFVTIQGHVVHNAAPVAWVYINGTEVAIQPDDTFELPYQAHGGLNILEAELWDLFDGHDKVVQGFILSNEYTPMNATNPDVSMIQDSVMIYMGQTVWDDNDIALNDFAAFLVQFFAGINLNDYMPQMLYESGSYYVYAPGGVTYDLMQLDITCIHGGLHVRLKIPNVEMNITADGKHWYTPGASGRVTIDYLAVDMDFFFTVDGDGNVTATLANTASDVHGMNISLDGVLGFLFNWLVDFFEGMIANILEDQIEGIIEEQIPPVLESALEQLAFNTTFEIPPLFEGLDPVTLTLTSKVSTLDFFPGGSVIGLKAAVVTDKGVELPSLGSLHRNGCLTTEPPFAFWGVEEIEMGLSDDFLNQIPYAMWWAGLFSLPISTELLGGGSFEEFGIEDLSLNLTGLRAPVISDCTPDYGLLIQMGDLMLDVTMNMFGMDVHVVIYAAFEAEVEVDVVQGEGGQNELAMTLNDITYVQIELATVSENLVGSEDSLRLLLKQQILDKVLGMITENAMASIPIPTIELGSMIPGLPPGASLNMKPKETYRDRGYTVISGTVHE